MLGAGTAAILGLVASLLVVLVSSVAGFFGWLIIIIGAPTAGMLIAEVARYATRKHRARENTARPHG